jgi:hypothetical protein
MVLNAIQKKIYKSGIACFNNIKANMQRSTIYVRYFQMEFEQEQAYSFEIITLHSIESTLQFIEVSAYS